ncbi:MAG: cation:proton antiporter [Bacteroides sp.]|nr:cation:proton antiporter [Bacteroides sp.]
MEQLIFLSSGSHFSTNIMVIVGSLIVIISYLFNLVAKRYSIPSVLLLIILGVALHGLVSGTGIESPDLTPILEVLGTVGLIMIVLEASLDLELTGGKRKLISKAFFTALVSLIVTSLLVGGVMILYLKVDLTSALLYAVPLSIMSSAIIIPSIGSLEKDKQEFMIYESTFSDILGIMLFYFLISSLEASSFGEMSLAALLNLSLTVLVSVAASYFLIFLFQKIRTELKLFLLIAVLILLYSISKIFHLSSLLIILVFGMILSNRQLFFPGKMRKYLDEDHLKGIFVNFKMITLETSFVVRTFFFVIFGFTIVLATLLDLKVWLVSLTVIAIIYGSRYLYFRIFFRKNLFPDIWLAPRGLITILLFYSIPEALVVEEFNQGILLLVILISSLAMAFALIRHRKRSSREVELELIKGEEEILLSEEKASETDE